MRYLILAMIIGTCRLASAKDLPQDQIRVTDNVWSVGTTSMEIYNRRRQELLDARDFEESKRRFDIKTRIELEKIKQRSNDERAC